jgi:hypothetical protein
LNVYAGITKFGVTGMCKVAGTTKHISQYTNKQGNPAKNITSQEYYHVVYDHLLPEGKRLFSCAGISKWFLQQDNDPTHKVASTKALEDWKQKCPGSVVEVLPQWPPNSPDLSPIENVWGYVQAEVNKAGCKNFDEFQAKVQEVFKNLSQKHVRNLFNSMKGRIEECMAKKGARIKH